MHDLTRFTPAPLPPASPDLETADFGHDLACRSGLTEADWAGIEARARALGSDPFDLAIGEGALGERDFAAALAGMIDAVFTAEPPAPSEACRAEEAMALRSYSTRDAEGRRMRVIAPNGALAGMLGRQKHAGRMPAVILTTRQALLDRLVAAESTAIAWRAAHTLAPHLSAHHDTPSAALSWRAGVIGLAILAGLIAVAFWFPVHALVLPPLLLGPIFVIAGLATLTATFASGDAPVTAPPVGTANLPRYSLLVPLSREANIVEALVQRLSALLYPRDRIEVLILVETDDAETLEALQHTDLPPWFLILRVPAGAPRTKPRALNAALPFCTGDLLVVFDAEDRPEADQLLRAAALFRALPEPVACLQARLAISNVRDGFLTRRFAIDYAALFDCVKAGMGRAEWPVTLGGSSNHFKVPVLRQVGGWDAWNVTEDADLGLRLVRLGWRVEDLRSTTWEEAPNTLAGWMNQRTRWMKGWLQTFAVHARDPRQFVASLGVFRAAIILSIGIAVLAGAMLYPIFVAAVVLRLIHPMPLGSGSLLFVLADSMLVLALIVAVLVECLPALVALRRRKALYLAPYVLLAPLTHLLICFALWRAMVELIRRPYYWHKTAHGQTRRDGGLSSIDAPGSGSRGS